MSATTDRPSARPDGRTRLIESAIELIARDGKRAATVRRVAESAGVSAPLVVHHFGSKEGLVDACDREVRRVIDDLVAELTSTGAERGVQQLLGDPHAALALMYIGRALHDDADMGRVWFDELYALTRTGLDGMQAEGIIRRVDDAPMTAVLLLAMDLGMVLLRHHVERVVGTDLTDPATTERWVSAEFDLLTRSLFEPQPEPAEPAEPSESPDHLTETS